ncbi:MAG: hypothetical protein HY761_10230, partial [Candidatus Omnitrophica bacterium]|nr:hypothetical protein [Candidatus Omnitrophota bacterium]
MDGVLMKNKLLIIAILIYALSMSVPLNTLAQVFEETLPKEGISAEDFLRTVNYYYENPQPQKLFTCLIVILTQEEVIKDPDKFNLFARFCALVCRKDSNFLENIKRLKEKSSGIQQNAIQQILTYAENYEEPYMIFSAGDLECFLIEFL